MSMKKPRKTFTKKNDLILIEFVKKNPVLYLYKPSRSSASLNENLWRKLGDYLDKPSKQCRLRWHQMRKSHYRALIRNQKYMYSDLLKFLDLKLLASYDEQSEMEIRSYYHTSNKDSLETIGKHSDNNIIREVVPADENDDEIVFHVKIGDSSYDSELTFTNTGHTLKTARCSPKDFVIDADKVGAGGYKEKVFDINDCDENNPNYIRILDAGDENNPNYIKIIDERDENNPNYMKILDENENKEIRGTESISLLESSDEEPLLESSDEELTVVSNKNKPDENIVKRINDEWSDNNSDDEAELGYSITVINDEPIIVIDE